MGPCDFYKNLKTMDKTITLSAITSTKAEGKRPSSYSKKQQLDFLRSLRKELKEFDLKIDLVSLAKREEEVFKPNESKPVIFPIKSPALHLFQRI